jgi:hypothetical protein
LFDLQPNKKKPAGLIDFLAVVKMLKKKKIIQLNDQS